MSNLPNFLGIGAQKAGTTWLHCNLKAHPNIFLPDEKELHFFDKPSKVAQGIDSYANYFYGTTEKVRGEITPAYSILPVDRIRFIQEQMPNVRLVLLLRNPIDRAWSHALMALVRKKKRKYNEVSDVEFIDHFRNRESVERGDYAMIIKNWLRVFRDDQLFVGIFDDIAQRPRVLLSSIFKHLEVASDVNWEIFPYNEIIHEGYNIPLPSKYRPILAEIYVPRLRELVDIVPLPASTWLAEAENVLRVDGSDSASIIVG